MEKRPSVVPSRREEGHGVGGVEGPGCAGERRRPGRARGRRRKKHTEVEKEAEVVPEPAARRAHSRRKSSVPLAQAVHSLLFAGGHMGYGLLDVRLFVCFVFLSLSCLLRHFVPVHSFVFVVGPLLFSMAFVIPFLICIFPPFADR